MDLGKVIPFKTEDPTGAEAERSVGRLICDGVFSFVTGLSVDEEEHLVYASEIGPTESLRAIHAGLAVGRWVRYVEGLDGDENEEDLGRSRKKALTVRLPEKAKMIGVHTVLSHGLEHRVTVNPLATLRHAAPDRPFYVLARPGMDPKIILAGFISKASSVPVLPEWLADVWARLARAGDLTEMQCQGGIQGWRVKDLKRLEEIVHGIITGTERIRPRKPEQEDPTKDDMTMTLERRRRAA